MKRIKDILAGTAFVVVVMMVAFVVGNLQDESLDQEAKALLKTPAAPPEGMVRGFKYLLGLRVPADQDPRVEGEGIYLRFRTALELKKHFDRPLLEPSERSLGVVGPRGVCAWKAYCPKDVFDGEKARFQEELKAAEILLKRFDELLAFGGYASDLKPSFVLSVARERLSILAELKRMQLNAFLHAGRDAEVVAQLEKMNTFFSQSLQYPMSYIEAKNAVDVIARNREFLAEAVKEYPALKSRLTEDRIGSFRVRMDFASLMQRIAFYEVSAFADVLTTANDMRVFELSDIAAKPADARQEGVVESITHRLSNFFMPLLIKKNRSLNFVFNRWRDSIIADCVKTDYPCHDVGIQRDSLTAHFVNPLGRRLARMLATVGPEHIKRLYVTMHSLREPLVF